MLKNLKFLLPQSSREPSWTVDGEWSENAPGVPKWTWVISCRENHWGFAITLSIFVQIVPFVHVK